MAEDSNYVKELQEEIARREAENAALVQEFTKTIKEGWTPEIIKEKLDELMPKAYEVMIQLMDDPTTPESVRAKLVTYIFDVARNPGKGAGGEHDPDKDLKELLADLKKNDVKPA